MSQKLTVTVVGREEEIKEFVDMLKEKKIAYNFPKREKTVYREEGERLGFLTYEQLLIILSNVLSIVVVELTKEALKSIMNWLKEKRKKRLKRPELKVIVEGNILDLSQKDMKILMDMLEKVSKETTDKK